MFIRACEVANYVFKGRAAIGRCRGAIGGLRSAIATLIRRITPSGRRTRAIRCGFCGRSAALLRRRIRDTQNCAAAFRGAGPVSTALTLALSIGVGDGRGRAISGVCREDSAGGTATIVNAVAQLLVYKGGKIADTGGRRGRAGSSRV